MDLNSSLGELLGEQTKLHNQETWMRVLITSIFASAIKIIVLLIYSQQTHLSIIREFLLTKEPRIEKY
jgi:surface polysaccharide O-acyltransferase-like enzyme